MPTFLATHFGTSEKPSVCCASPPPRKAASRAARFLRSRGYGSPSDPLRYEKIMLDDWFRSRFASHLRKGG